MRRRMGLLGLVLALLLPVGTSWGSAASAADVAPPDNPGGVSAAQEQQELADVGTIPDSAWAACGPELPSALQCTTLSVPLDYDHRGGGRTVQLALSRLPHDPALPYQGVMLTNPGGPGGSGLIFAILGLFVPNDVGRQYDWIGFDPRGVGASVPALTCDPTYAAGPRPPYEPTTPAIERAWLTKVQTYARACGRAGGDLLDHVKTVDNVRDMNAIRKALGVRQINYYGFSYGTYLGQVFATLYPNRVHRMVLDSNVDPRKVWYQANLDQDTAFQVVLEHFFDWVARHDSTYGLGTTQAAVTAKFNAVKASLTAHPQGELGPAELTDALTLSGYVQAVWPQQAQALSDLANRNDPAAMTAEFESFVDTTDDNGYAMYLATECTEGSWPSQWSVWRRDNTRVAATAPFLTWANAWFNAPCAFWPARSSRPVEVRGDKAPPVLLLGETLDAATPFSGSIEVRQRFGRSALVATDGGTTHANSLAGYACVDDKVAAYLADGTLPARVRGQRADVTCPGLPEPEPTAAAVASSAGAGSRADISLRLHLVRNA